MPNLQEFVRQSHRRRARMAAILLLCRSAPTTHAVQIYPAQSTPRNRCTLGTVLAHADRPAGYRGHGRGRCGHDRPRQRRRTGCRGTGYVDLVHHTGDGKRHHDGDKQHRRARRRWRRARQNPSRSTSVAVEGCRHRRAGHAAGESGHAAIRSPAADALCAPAGRDVRAHHQLWPAAVCRLPRPVRLQHQH